MQIIALINQKGRGEKKYSKTINKNYKLFLLKKGVIYKFE